MKSKGMTLMEIMIAIIIVSLMASFTIPSFKWAIEKSRAQEALTLLPQIRDAYMAYYYESGSYAGSSNPATALNQTPLDIKINNLQYFNTPQISNNISFGVVSMIRNNTASIGYALHININGDIVCCASPTYGSGWACPGDAGQGVCKNLGLTATGFPVR